MSRGLTFGLAGLGLVALAGSASGQSAAPPPAEDFVVLSRTDATQGVEAQDMRFLLVKARREEHALVRRLIFITATLRLTEPEANLAEAPEGAAAAPQTCRWSYRSAMQRQICFTSMTGLLSCTQPEVTPLPDEAQGDATAPKDAPPGFCNDAFRPAANARIRLSSALIARSKTLFEEDQKARVEPLFKAAGVIAKPEPPPRAPARRLRNNP